MPLTFNFAILTIFKHYFISYYVLTEIMYIPSVVITYVQNIYKYTHMYLQDIIKPLDIINSEQLDLKGWFNKALTCNGQTPSTTLLSTSSSFWYTITDYNAQNIVTMVYSIVVGTVETKY